MTFEITNGIMFTEKLKWLKSIDLFVSYGSMIHE